MQYRNPYVAKDILLQNQGAGGIPVPPRRHRDANFYVFLRNISFMILTYVSINQEDHILYSNYYFDYNTLLNQLVQTETQTETHAFRQTLRTFTLLLVVYYMLKTST